MGFHKVLMAFRKKPVKGTKGLGEAKENLTSVEDGDCPRCGGGSNSSSIPGYLSCDRCQYEWADPNNQPSRKTRSHESVKSEAKLIEEFKQEMESGTGLSRVLGIDEDLTSEQEQGLTRLQDKWIEG
jgi:ribosomal protein L37AE/L43A